MRTIPILKSIYDGADMLFRNSSDVRNSNQGLRNLFEAVEKKASFLGTISFAQM